MHNDAVGLFFYSGVEGALFPSHALRFWWFSGRRTGRSGVDGDDDAVNRTWGVFFFYFHRLTVVACRRRDFGRCRRRSGKTS